VYISSAAPNKPSLDATNGVTQTMVSIQPTVGPAAAASLFAFSLDNNILGGNFVYVVLLTLVWVELGVAMRLPKNIMNNKFMKKGGSNLMRADLDLRQTHIVERTNS